MLFLLDLNNNNPKIGKLINYITDRYAKMRICQFGVIQHFLSFIFQFSELFFELVCINNPLF